MRGFVLGVIVTLVVLMTIVIAVAQLGLYPIGADNPPSPLEHTLAGRAMDVYADKHKPAGDNPIALTAANLTQGALHYEDTARCATVARKRKSARMPAWTGILSDDDIWKIVAFIKHSEKLPPETQAAWQASAANR
jgi:cytochrome c553